MSGQGILKDVPRSEVVIDFTNVFGAEIETIKDKYFPTPSKPGDGAVDLKARIEPLTEPQLETKLTELLDYVDYRPAGIYIDGIKFEKELNELAAELGSEFRILYPGDRATIPTGFRIATYCYIHGLVANFRVQPRSGLAHKFGVTVLNSPGLVDPNYRGEVGVILANQGETIQIFKDGARIAQGVLALEGDPNVGIYKQVNKLDENTSRGAAGYGSTGV